MGWFRTSGKVEILNVRWPLITWWSNEGQVNLWRKTIQQLIFYLVLKDTLIWTLIYYLNTIIKSYWIKLYFFGSPRNEWLIYIKNFNCSWIPKVYHLRADIFTFLLIFSKRISSLVFVGSWGSSCCFDEDFDTLTYSFIIST